MAKVRRRLTRAEKIAGITRNGTPIAPPAKPRQQDDSAHITFAAAQPTTGRRQNTIGSLGEHLAAKGFTPSRRETRP